MKKTILITPFLFAVIFFFNIVPVLAVDPTSIPSVTPVITPKPTGIFRGIWEKGRRLFREDQGELKDLKKEIEDDRLHLQGTISPKREDLKATNTQQRLENRRRNLQTLYNEIHSMLTERYDLLNTAKIKVAAKITDRKALGKDVSAAETRLATFDSAVTAYNTDLTAFEKKFIDLLASAGPKKMVKDLQDSAKLVRTDLQNLHKILIDTLRLLIQTK